MARKLTKKQRGFVNDYADGITATQAALNNYKIKSHKSKELTARVIGAENLTKPNIIEELKNLGFDSNNAKRVVSEILNNHHEESSNRLRAAETIFKVQGEYAPEKVVYLNVEVNPTQAIKELAQGLLERQRATEVVEK